MNETTRRSLGATAGAIAFSVNGVAHSVTAHPATRLSDVLREELGLTGTKVGCNAGDCGACTVLVDGKQVCACLTAVAQVEGRSVVTVEGLASHDTFARLQRSFHAHGAAQCGICSPGMLLAAADLLARKAKPTEADVCDALGGVLCRCTGYVKILDAIDALAQEETTDVELPRGIGTRGIGTGGCRVTMC